MNIDNSLVTGTKLEATARSALRQFCESRGIKLEVYLQPVRPSRISNSLRALDRSNQQKLSRELLENLVTRTRLRILVESTEDCYSVLGAVHLLWTPVKGKIRDYIAEPKFNGYQMLQTVVRMQNPRDSKKYYVEIFICSNEQHLLNQWGRVQEWREGGREPKELVERAWWHKASQRNDIFNSYQPGSLTNPIYIFSPLGKLYELEIYSTPVDFGFAVHSDLGQYFYTSVVNGLPTETDYRLRNFDIVEVHIDPAIHNRPSHKWMKSIQTESAYKSLRHKSRTSLLKAKRGDKILTKVIDRHCNAAGLKIAENRLRMYLNKFLSQFKYEDIDLLYGNIASGLVSPDSIANRIVSQEIAHRITYSNDEPLGLKAESIRLAQCCKPALGDSIVGVFRNPLSKKKKHLKIHKKGCPSVNISDEVVNLNWRVDGEDTLVEHAILGNDRHAILLDILVPFYDGDAYLYEVHAKRLQDGNAQISLIAKHRDLLSQERIHRIIQEKNDVYEITTHAIGLSEKNFHNEYSVSSLFPYNKPVFQKGDFVGRFGDLNIIREFISGNENALVICGPWRVGKTSLLKYLQHYDQSEFKAIATYINCHGFNDWHYESLLEAIATKVSKRMQQEIAGLHSGELVMSSVEKQQFQTDPVSAFNQYFERIGNVALDLNLEIVLMLDEFSDYFDEMEHGVVTNRLFGRLRNLVETSQNLKFIFVVQAKAINRMQKIDQGGELLSITRLHLLHPPAHAEMKALIKRRATKAGLTCDENVIIYVLLLTGCNPYLTNIICQEVADKMVERDKKEIVFEDAIIAATNIIRVNRKGRLYLQHLTQLLESKIEKAIMQYLSQRLTPPSHSNLIEFICRFSGNNSFQLADSAIQSLEDKGMLFRHEKSTKSPHYAAQIPLLCTWLHQYPIILDILD